ncbi:putative acetyl xylan Esterase/Acetylesterase [Anopheles sinensis]|uniref:Putative acetyl xylan Esterase/Acetylesterase n=1 Tax=Anopheles sinensis TaxID=74873 RepID=A0A084VTX3_ANOSI|nr:putative acetyl xylan Esterase/Acetylesterase [Anopheles sinensis]
MKHVFTLLLLAVLAFALVAGEDSSQDDRGVKNAPLPAVDNAGPQPSGEKFDYLEPALKPKRSISVDETNESPSTEEDTDGVKVN